MNKKGITPIIAVVLLLMMTVAAAGAAFYWLTRMQQQVQAGVSSAQQKLIEEASASLALVSQSFDSTGEVISVDIQNTGGRSIPLGGDKVIGVLEDGDGNAMCAAAALNATSGGFSCDAIDGCTGTLTSNQVTRLVINITACGNLSSSITYYYQLKFLKGATVSGSFST